MRQLEARAQAMIKRADRLTDPDVSIVIRTRNDGGYVKQLFEDIKAQLFDGKVEVIVVDTESTDGTAEYATARGAKIIRINQQEFSYPHALNLGFKAAKYPYVVTLVGHSNLTNRLMLKSLTYWCQQERFGGMYCYPLSNSNGTIWDHVPIVCTMPWVLPGPLVTRRIFGGVLGANGSIVKREVWQKLGGYDERYAGGGEDVALARSMLDNGYSIIREPLCVVFHSHGLNFINTIRQYWHWFEVGKKPTAFQTAKVHARRPDLR